MARRRWDWRSRPSGVGMLACADVDEGVVLRDAGVAAPILVFGALGISDLDGIFSHRLTPTISSPWAGRALAEAAAAREHRARLPRQDRHRHESPRPASRQPAAHAARDPRGAVAARRRAVHALCHRRRARERALRRCSSSSSSRRATSPPSSACGPRMRMRPTARPCCATSASGSMPCVPACCSTASSPPPLMTTLRARAGALAAQPHRRGQGRA